MDRVVITGLGTVNPLGLTVQETWENALDGVSGVGMLTRFDASAFQVKVVCEVKGFNLDDYLPAREARRRDRFEQFSAVAVQQALHQSGLEIGEELRSRMAVVISSAIGGIESLVEAVFTVRDQGPRRTSPFAIPMLMSNGAAGMAAIDHGIQGPSFSVASACASGIDGIGAAWMMIRAGLVDAAIAGASEACLTPVGLGTFDRVGAVSRAPDPAAGVPRPFDLHRDGLVMGEGAAVLVLERESLARKRGAPILAELAGYAATADAYHVTAPEENGRGGARAMRLALSSAGVDPSQVDYINAHGTGTQLNDIAETRAIKTAFGNLAYNIPVSSTKSMTGHMMGATGALEAIFCVMAVKEGCVPPTINYQTPDPQCDLDYIPNQARQLPVQVALNNAFGFGGHNAVLVIKRYT